MRVLFLIVLIAFMAATSFDTPTAHAAQQQITVTDIWQRRLNDREIMLVDWQGFMANPAIQLKLTPPPDARFPFTATLTADNPRLYFDLAPECLVAHYIYDPCNTSTVSGTGPKRTVRFRNKSSQTVYLSIFPDRDNRDESYHLTIKFKDSTGANITQEIPISVIDQDVDLPLNFNITLDYSQDKSTFFSDPKFGKQRQAIVQQATDDWAYFIDDMELDPYEAKPVEQGAIYDSVKDKYTCIKITQPYDGLQIYIVPVSKNRVFNSSLSYVSVPAICPGAGKLRHNGKALDIARSGGINLDMLGNYNRLGYFLTKTDDDWWQSTNLPFQPNDLYSVVHHELGHVIAFAAGNPIFAQACLSGFLINFKLYNYYQKTIPFSSKCHFDLTEQDSYDGVVDPESLKPAFGNEYSGLMPNRRWLITKFDLLGLEAAGYKLRPVSAFKPVTLLTESVMDATVGEDYWEVLEVEGGIPFYNWSIESGKLPDGLQMDDFIGLISGAPTKPGTYKFTVRVRDYNIKSTGAAHDYTIVVKGA